MATVWCDGKFIDEQNFRVSPHDRGLCHGFSLFETLLAVDGKPKLLPEHLERMRGGLQRLGVDSVELDASGLNTAMVSLLERNGLLVGSARLRFSLSFGEGPLNQTDSGRAWAWMTASRAAIVAGAVRVNEAPWKKNIESVTRGLKVGNYAEHLIAMDMARREGFGEMLFFNTNNELCEAAMANVFLIKGGGLLTPSLDSGCLAGVSRALVLRIAREQGISIMEKPLGRSDVAKADGMFLTSSVQGPVEVSYYGLNSYAPHPLFKNIRAAWLARMGIK
ncbi:MAG: aminotransferase class IV [Akkermansiaceae bacterium]|jgi:branched-chain amino acid aminotransferase|nr:aminotransferase class IV [Akkermansiaceae bacterium]MDP4645942.1 aminotransferase class IV [Akkermansiaceae bacterium]MDP4722416.1 aminotransferase class IV [Akkermansiaceae bacterium]MDP4781151.1 aminotransferase class IV [Akkermansiaceae bacterium]MDP4846499.1 aminotransferase class IV [Akkermansiaceae bacterium]